MLKYLIATIFTSLSFLFYYINFSYIESFQIFLTISTFLFATFTGFFIARQGKRYSEIRGKITSFDGEMSGMFRQFGHLGKNIQIEAQKIISNHYKIILKNKAWDYHFVNKSTTITSMNNLLDKEVGNKALKSLKNLSLREILCALQRLQVIRKKMIALHNERIPAFQWIIVFLLAIVLVATLSAIPSQFLIIESMLKSIFAVAVISILILLNKLNKLKFFENTMGEESAQDILNIFKGER